MMVHNIKTTDGDMNEILRLYPSFISKFIESVIEGSIEEICGYALMEFRENREIGRFEKFMSEMVFVDVCYESLKKFLAKIFVEDRNNVEMYLDSLCKKN